MITVKGQKTLILKDGGANGAGSIISAGTVVQAIEGATIKVESGKYKSTGANGFWAGSKTDTGHIIIDSAEVEAQECAVCFGKDSTVVINNGTFTTVDNSVVSGNGTAGAGGSTVTINGGQFNGNIQSTGWTGCGVYMPNDGSLTINGGEFNVDGVGVCARAGKVEIKGGTFNSTSTREGWVGDKKTAVPAHGVVYDGAANYPGLANGENSLNISGGTYINSADPAMAGVKVTQPTNGYVVTANPGDWTVAE